MQQLNAMHKRLTNLTQMMESSVQVNGFVSSALKGLAQVHGVPREWPTPATKSIYSHTSK
jgi:hypothetical protein